MILTALGSEVAKSNDRAAADAHLERALAILMPLRQANPQKPTLLRDLADCYEALGSTREAELDWRGAESWYARTGELWDAWPSIATSSVYDAAQRKRVTGLLENARRKARASAKDR